MEGFCTGQLGLLWGVAAVRVCKSVSVREAENCSALLPQDESNLWR